jgi:hypothetical protein
MLKMKAWVISFNVQATCYKVLKTLIHLKIDQKGTCLKIN